MSKQFESLQFQSFPKALQFSQVSGAQKNEGTYDQKEMQFVGTHTLSASLSVTKSDRDVHGGCHPHQVLFLHAS